MNLREYYLFRNFDDKQLNEISDIAFEKSFASGETIFMEGESSKYLHILKSGRVDISKSNSKFGEFFLHSIEAQSMIAELATFERIPFPATARASLDCIVIKIDFEVFKEKLLSNPDISYAFIKSLLQKMKILEGFIQKEMSLDAEEKVISLLRGDPKIFESKKRVEIARLINVTPETLSRTIKKLKSRGIIEIDKKTLWLAKESAKA